MRAPALTLLASPLRRLSPFPTLAALAFVACADPVDPDAGPQDASPNDTGASDVGPPGDAGFLDATTPDSGDQDAGLEDQGLDAAPVVIVEVAYGANADDLLIQHLYLTESSTITRRVTPELAGAPAGGKKQQETGGLQQFAWTFDGSRLVYQAHQDTFNLPEVYQSVISAGRPGVPTKVSPQGGASGVSLQVLSPVANALVYNNNDDFYVDLTQTPLEPRQINTGLISNLSFSPNGAYLAFRDIIVSATDRDAWFYDIATGTKERVNPGANLGAAIGPFWSPDSQSLYYGADEFALRSFHLYTTAVTGGALGPRTLLHPMLPADRSISAQTGASAVSPDGRWLAATVDLTALNVDELVVFDLLLPFPQALVPRNGPIAPPAMAGVLFLTFNPTSNRLVYRARQDTPNNIDAYVTDLNFGTPPAKISPPLAGSDNVVEVQWAKGGAVVLLGTREGPDRQLYAVDVSTLPPGAPVHLTAGLGPNETDPNFGVSPDGRYVVLQTINAEGEGSLYLIDLSGPGPWAPVRIASTRPYSPWCWSPDGARFAFAANLDRPTTNELYLLDRGQTTPVKISGPMQDGASVFQCAFPP
ncbi:MAG: PD40 domain-containing protein [Deltaproteobacteria bacterium]|nr:PD40 domain-containing protein [Deltaproteobacteria bacterium]